MERTRHPERGLADDQLVLEWPARRLALRVDLEANGPELHLGDRLVAISSLGCGREPNDVASFHLRQHALERQCRQVMALIHDDMAVPGNEVFDLVLAN